MKLNLLPNAGTEIHRPVTENQVVKMSTSFSVTLQGLLKIRCRHPALDFTRNRISWSFWPTEKAGRAGGHGFANFLTASLPKSTGQNGPLKGVKGERLAQ